MFLTELNIDSKDITIYDISSLILVAEKIQNSLGNLKCYMDNETYEFYVEVSNDAQLPIFNKTFVLNMLDLAESAGAQ